MEARSASYCYLYIKFELFVCLFVRPTIKIPVVEVVVIVVEVVVIVVVVVVDQK